MKTGQRLTRLEEGDVLVELYDEEKNAVVLMKREDYESWVTGGTLCAEVKDLSCPEGVKRR